MFKRIALLFVLLLALAGTSALAAESTVVLETEKSPTGYNYIFSDGETLYMRAPNYLGVWHPGDEKPTDYRIVLPNGNDYFISYPFADGGKLYSVIAERSTDEDGTLQLGYTALYTLTLSGDEAVCDEVCELDWRELTYEDGQSTMIYEPVQVLAVNGKVFILFHESSSHGPVPRIARLSIEDEELELMDDLEDVWHMTPYKDGMLMLVQKETDDEETRLTIYDPEEEEEKKFAKFEVEEVFWAFAPAYDPASDSVLYSFKGVINAIEEGDDEPGKQLVAVPLRDVSYYSNALMLPDGRYAVCAGDVALVDLSADVGDRVALTVCDNWQTMAADRAIQSLRATAPNISVLKIMDEEKIGNLVENMMNQDDSVDIYTLPTSSEVYDALFKRGFMSRLDGNAVIAEHVGEMYPSIQDSVAIDGHIVALPVEADETVLGFGEKPLQKLGLSLETLPDNWSDLLDLMSGLKEGIDENDLHFTMDYMTTREVRQNIFKVLMSDYMTYMRANPDMGFNTELLRGLLEKLDKLDLEALGVAGDADGVGDSDYGLDYSDINTEVLLQTDLIPSFRTQDLQLFRPVLMKLNEEDAGRMNLYLVVAFINPYSKHPEAAMRFMEELTRSLSNDTRYTMKPGLTEPIRGKSNEQTLEEYRDTIEQLNRQLEKAEGVARVTLEDEISYNESSLKEMEKNKWEIAQRDIDWFRSHDDTIAVQRMNWLDTEEDLVNQYLDGDISPTELLEKLDRKVRMMRMEGN